tara:strand:- start:628 stop:1056 length:429 start_codon:yes stop_codon:yes gene_type:complete
MKIIIGSDHAGFDYKEDLLDLFRKKKIFFKDCGCFSSDSVDYPDYAHLVSKEVLKESRNLGVLICGSANGVAMAANKHTGIRAAIAWNKKTSELAVTHNNANILCVPARFISRLEQREIFEAFLNSTFEGGRHKHRVSKINC